MPDADGALFRRLTNGWVPCNILVSADGKVLFSENEFDEAAYTRAIEMSYGKAVDDGKRAPGDGRVGGSKRGSSTTVILGGGTGGLVAAHRLRKRLSRDHRIVVIDRSPDHLFAPSLLWLAVGQRREAQIRRPLQRLNRKGIEFHQAEVSAIDLTRRIVRTSSAEFPFDYLIISLGAELDPKSVPGFDDLAHNLYDPAGCQGLRDALEQFSGGTIGVWVSSMPFKCPAAPCEAAFLVEAYCRRKGLREKTDIHIFTPEHQPMPVAGRALGEALMEMMRWRGIHYRSLYTSKGLDVEKREIVPTEGLGTRLDLLIGIPPHVAPQVVRDAGLVGPSGWVPVEPGTLQTKAEGVYAIGDIAAVKLPNGKMLPKAGVFAHNEAEIVADNIASEIDGSAERKDFDGKGYCWIELGDGKAGFANGQFFAEPEPAVKMYKPGRGWHWGKVGFEKWWLHHWF